MNPEQARQAQAKRDEDSIRALDEDLRFLHWQIEAYPIVKTKKSDN